MDREIGQTDRLYYIKQTDRLDKQTIQVDRQIEIDILDQIDIWIEIDQIDRQIRLYQIDREIRQIDYIGRQVDRQRQIRLDRYMDRDRLDQIDIWTEIDQIILDRQIRQIDYIGRQIDIDRYIDRLDIWTEMDQIERQIRLYQTDRLDSWMDRDRLDLIDRQIDQIRQVGGWTNGRWTVVWMNGLKDLQIMCGRAEQTSPCSRLPCRTVAVKFPLACVPSRRQSCWLFEQQSVLLRDRRNKRGKDPCRRGDHHTCAWFQLSCVLLAEFTAMSLGFIQRLPVRQDRG